MLYTMFFNYHGICYLYFTQFLFTFTFMSRLPWPLSPEMERCSNWTFPPLTKVLLTISTTLTAEGMVEAPLTKAVIPLIGNMGVQVEFAVSVGVGFR